MNGPTIGVLVITQQVETRRVIRQRSPLVEGVLPERTASLNIVDPVDHREERTVYVPAQHGQDVALGYDFLEPDGIDFIEHPELTEEEDGFVKGYYRGLVLVFSQFRF